MTLLDTAANLSRVTVTRPPTAPAPGYDRARPAAGRVSVVLVGLLAVAALIVGVIGLMRPSATVAAPPARVPVSAEPAPISAADAAAAKNAVCTVFDQVSTTVRVATSAPGGAEPIAAAVNARSALVGGALALTRALSDATPPDVANAANALVDQYSHYAVVAFADGELGQSDSAPVQKASADLRRVCST